MIPTCWHCSAILSLYATLSQVPASSGRGSLRNIGNLARNCTVLYCTVLYCNVLYLAHALLEVTHSL